MDNLLFKDIDPKVYKWNFLEINTTGLRVYYKSKELGFNFYVLESIGYINNGNPEWSIDNTYIEVIFSGIAYFDGIRHLYTGDKQTDNYGYLYYPRLEAYKETFDVLSELEEKYCNK